MSTSEAEPVVRPARWPDDEAAIGAIEASYTTDRIYRLERGEMDLRLIPHPIDPPYHKVYPPMLGREGLRGLGHVVVAELDGRVVGVLAAALSAWNRRVWIEGLYVADAARRRGVGRALVESAIGYARRVGSPCLWLETQNTNYGAIQFYRRVGFRLCGLDERLYDPTTNSGNETALFFAMDLF